MKAVCGLDVHKDSVCLCVLSEFGELIEKVFGVLTYHLKLADKVLYSLDFYRAHTYICTIKIQRRSN